MTAGPDLSRARPHDLGGLAHIRFAEGNSQRRGNPQEAGVQLAVARLAFASRPAAPSPSISSPAPILATSVRVDSWCQPWLTPLATNTNVGALASWRALHHKGELGRQRSLTFRANATFGIPESS